MTSERAKAYAGAGVDITAGNELVSRIKQTLAKTQIRGVVSDVGGFGGLFRPDLAGMDDPILVSSTDGVGTKLKLAFAFDRHDTVGIDLVAMSVNDILVQGAKPLFFLDYFATGSLDVEKAQKVIEGIADGCKIAQCALLGGETAEMPDMYAEGEYDLAGFCVGIVDNSKIIDGAGIRIGHKLVGVASSGLHANGYSLVRKIFEESSFTQHDLLPGSEQTFADALLTPTTIYVDIIKHLLRDVPISGMVHITGGGFYDNIPRILPMQVQVNIQFGSWEVPPIFQWLKDAGKLSWPEMLQIFNCGIGYVIVVPEENAAETVQRICAMNTNAWIIGSVEKIGDVGAEAVNVVFDE